MTFLDQLRRPAPTLTVELRPPRVDQQQAASMDAWFSMHAAALGLAGLGVPLFLTDGAVGAKEEENLHHLITNLEGDLDRSLICPFLTTKHTLEYCMWYAARAVEAGCDALTILGGDKHVGAPRCVPHGYVLRQLIRERFPALALGGWANPHQDPRRQVDYIEDDTFTADFYLTQLVSHLDLAPLDAFLAELDRRNITLPAVYGVFYYRSGRLKTLNRLAQYFPVPVKAVRDAFKAGETAESLCAATIRALYARGVSNVYVSNLDAELAPIQLEAIRALI